MKLAKLVLTVTALLSIAVPSASQSIIVNDQMQSKASNWCKPTLNVKNCIEHPLAKGINAYTPINKKENASEDGLVNVTIQLNYDQSEMYPSRQFTIVGENYSDDMWLNFDDENNANTTTCHIPAGTYDLLIPGRFINDSGIIYSVKELVEIYNDTTIIFDFAESNVKYSFKSLKPNGEEAKLNEYVINERWEVTDTVSKGNTDYFADDIMLIQKEYGIVALYDCTTQFKKAGQNSGETVFVNRLSDRYKIASSRVFEDANGVYVVKYETNQMNETLLTNSPEDFVLYDETFISIGSDTNELFQGFKTYELIDNILIGGRQSNELRKISDTDTKLYVAVNRNDKEGSKFDILVQPIFQDSYFETAHYGITINDEEGNPIDFSGDIDINRTIVGLPVLFDKNGIVEYVNSGHAASGNYGFYDTEEGGDIILYPGHPRFSYSKHLKLLPFGSSCPINSLMSQNSEGLIMPCKYSNLEPCYIGRYGEIVSGCYTAEIRYNDSIICADCVLMPELLQLFAIQGNPDGIMRAHFENTNAVVDGLQGKNVTDVYYDQRQEDWTAPTLQMLQFKDSDGNINDRFNRSEDGIIEFAAGDFNLKYNIDTYRGWFECQPQIVEVSYAQYNSTSWETLEVTEVSDDFFMPGFGYFYRGSLKDVVGGNGWYDLKIKLTDLSGNWQEQLISPAFRIGNASTIISSVNDGSVTEVARYTVDGRIIGETQSGINIIKMSDGSVKKVLVK